jgi:hypothetical protein
MLRAGILATTLVALFASLSAADTVQLTNGDTLHGEVLALDAQSLTMKSETLGELKLARAKVAQIRFGDAPAKEAAALEAPPAAKPAPREQTADDVVRQLREQGIDPAIMRGVQDAIPLLNTSPEAQKYFGDRVGGLISGQLDIGDIRHDAETAVAELEDLKREFGPQMGPAIDPYLGILKRFLRETDPTPGAEKPSATDPPPPPKIDKELRELEKELKSGPT